jgi:4-hydroxy-tetrahydrodipicolinate synthase
MTVAPETYAELSRHPNIAGVKEAGTDLETITKAMSLCSDDFDFYCGNDSLALPLFALGAKGLISVASNIVPEAMSALCALCLAGRYEAARAINSEYYQLFAVLFCEVNPIPVKAALDMLGLCSSETRLPLTPLSYANREILAAVLKKYGLI